jgi:hypothetical protein
MSTDSKACTSGKVLINMTDKFQWTEVRSRWSRNFIYVNIFNYILNINIMVKTCMVKWSDKCCHTLCNRFTSDKICYHRCSFQISRAYYITAGKRGFLDVTVKGNEHRFKSLYKWESLKNVVIHCVIGLLPIKYVKLRSHSPSHVHACYNY